MKYNKNPSSGCRVFLADGQTDMTMLTDASGNFSIAPIQANILTRNLRLANCLKVE